MSFRKSILFPGNCETFPGVGMTLRLMAFESNEISAIPLECLPSLNLKYNFPSYISLGNVLYSTTKWQNFLHTESFGRKSFQYVRNVAAFSCCSEVL